MPCAWGWGLGTDVSVGEIMKQVNRHLRKHRLCHILGKHIAVNSLIKVTEQHRVDIISHDEISFLVVKSEKVRIL